MKIQSIIPPAAQRAADPGAPQPPEDKGPDDKVTLGAGERIGNAVIRSAKAAVPGAIAGAAGSVVGMGAFYTATWGLRVAGMAFEFPGFIAAGAVAGAVSSAFVEAAAGESTDTNLARNAMVAGGVGAALGVASQAIIWSKPF